jgi:hypothetical protein
MPTDVASADYFHLSLIRSFDILVGQIRDLFRSAPSERLKQAVGKRRMSRFGEEGARPALLQLVFRRHPETGLAVEGRLRRD